MRSVHPLAVLLLVLASSFAGGWASAQSYPTRPIRIPTTGPGSGADVVSRVIANELSASLGQPVIVENRAAGPTLAMRVASAPADGHTLLVWAGGLWLGPLLEPAPYEVFRDFAPISTLVRTPNVLVVTPSLPVKSVADLVKLAKAKPGELNYASGSNGSSSHLAGELFKFIANADIVRVVYKTAAQETTELMAGQVHMTFGSGASMAPQIKSGKVRALASAGSARSILFPDLPTVAETVPGFVSQQLYAFWGPAKTPGAIVKRLNQETVRALDKPEVRERLLNNGLEPMGGTPEQLTDLVKSEVARMSKLIKAIGVKPEGS